jgi:hypothetical protein
MLKYRRVESQKPLQNKRFPCAMWNGGFTKDWEAAVLRLALPIFHNIRSVRGRASQAALTTLGCSFGFEVRSWSSLKT